MNILICDDNELFVRYLHDKIKIYFGNENKIISIYSAMDLFEIDINDIDIVFLDIKLIDENGLKIAERLRKQNTKFILIFISSFIEYAPDGYKVNALRYVLKDQIELIISDVFDSIIDELGYNKKYVRFDFIGGSAEICTSDIIYIESRLHDAYFYLRNFNNNYRLRSTLNYIQSRLPEDEFVRIHQSFLVNLKCFVDAKNHIATLSDKTQLPISQKLFPKVKSTLFMYKGKK